MADKYVGDLATATPNLTDKLLGVNGSDAYQALVSDVAKKIIEDYAGTTLMGTAQSIASAFNSNNSAIAKSNVMGVNNRQGWTALTNGQDLNSVTEIGVYYAALAVAPTLLNCPEQSYFKMIVEGSALGATYVRQRIRAGSTSNAEYEYTRQTTNTGESWSEWVLNPLRSEVNAIANQGAKNLCIKTAMAGTIRGLTALTNSDGSFTLNGTTENTSATWSTITTPFTLPAGSYILSGDAEGSPVYMRGRTAAGTWVRGTFSLSEPTDVTLTLYFPANAVVDNATYYPMIRPAAIQDDTYVPYGMSNAVLTARMSTFGRIEMSAEGVVQANSSGEIDLADSAKYLFMTAANSASLSGLYIVTVTTAGVVGVWPVREATGITIATESRKLTLTNTVSTGVLYGLMRMI